VALALTACDLLVWTQMLCREGELATAEPKRLRYRLLHVAARITCSARRARLRIAQSWPWATDLARAFTRLVQLHDQVKPRHGPLSEPAQETHAVAVGPLHTHRPKLSTDVDVR
jgi:hypothetical protein